MILGWRHKFQARFIFIIHTFFVRDFLAYYDVSDGVVQPLRARTALRLLSILLQVVKFPGDVEPCGELWEMHGNSTFPTAPFKLRHSPVPIVSPNPSVIIFHETCTRHLTHVWRTQGAISGGHSQFGQQGRELNLYATLPETSGFPPEKSAAWNTAPGKAGFRIFLRPSKFLGWFFLSYCTVS